MNCPAIAERCECRFKAGHKGAVHRCKCGGAWKGTEPEIEPIRMPGGVSTGRAVVALVEFFSLYASLGHQ